MNLEELKFKTSIQLKTITDLINKTDLSQVIEIEKLSACRRFVSQFLNDLNQLE